MLQFLQVDQIKMTEGFGPKVPGFDHINFRDTKPRFPNLRNKIKKYCCYNGRDNLGEGGIKANT